MTSNTPEPTALCPFISTSTTFDFCPSIETAPNADLTPENILIVDDEEMIIDLLRHLFKDDGKIDIAYNGKDALELIEKKFYKLIISDIDMPKMDGISLFTEATSKFPEISNRFLFITGSLSQEKQLFFRKENVRYLTKPMKITTLRKEAANIITAN